MNYNFIDKTGQQYGTLKVIRRAPDAIFSSGKVVQWECICLNCGKNIIVTGSNLKKMKSCGCLQYKKGNRLEDLTGQVFGLLTVVKRAEDNILPSGEHQTKWLCKCQCGTEKSIRAAHLKAGVIRSCGCVKSFGERQIAQILTENKIAYKKEFSFPDLKNSNQNLLKFDFALFDSNKNLLGLIEFQGEQHYRQDNIAFGKMQREETDQLKKDYCSTHNLKLFEIKYSDNLKQKLFQIFSYII